MIILCHAIDDTELMLLRALLVAEDIPFFIVGEHFGSLYPGVQIASYNERRLLVPAENFEQAKAVIDSHRKEYRPTSHHLDLKSKFRIVCEAFIFWWFFPVGSRNDHSRVTNKRLNAIIKKTETQKFSSKNTSL